MHDLAAAVLHMFAQDPVSSAVGAIFAVTGFLFASIAMKG